MAGEQGSQSSTQVAGPWEGVFELDGVDGGPIDLDQIERKSFVLNCTIRYTGAATGLEGKGLPDEILDDVRRLDPAAEPQQPYTTDLASIPGPMRWFVGTYGAHTPAVIIHDRLIPVPDGLGDLTEQHADRYLRFMLQALGMRWLKRWIMWAGVALRTRWASKGWRRLSVVLWILAAVAGMSWFAMSAADGNGTGMIWASAAPFGAAFLWGRQYAGGVIAAIAAPWLLPPTVLALLGYVAYVVLEWGGGWLWGLLAGEDRRGSGSYRAEGL